jgi:hypothetical protein
MTDKQFEIVESQPQPQTRLAPHQASVAEIFFMITLAALAMGISIYVSQSLVYLVGAVVVVGGAVRFWPPANPIWGGIRGFAVGSSIAWFLFAFGLGDYYLRLSLILFLPPFGYILGVFYCESNQDLMQ